MTALHAARHLRSHHLRLFGTSCEIYLIPRKRDKTADFRSSGEAFRIPEIIYSRNPTTVEFAFSFGGILPEAGHATIPVERHPGMEHPCGRGNPSGSETVYRPRTIAGGKRPPLPNNPVSPRREPFDRRIPKYFSTERGQMPPCRVLPVRSSSYRNIPGARK
jgi:hypothetical protein